MITKEELLEILLWEKSTGKFFWKKPPKYKNYLLGSEAGYLKTDGYFCIQVNKVKYKRGRLCFLMEYGRFPKNCIDHKNGIRDDDRIENLREATIQQNSWNHAIRKKKQNLPMGVRINSPSGRYGARIAYNNKMIYLGAFDTPQEAEQVYRAKRRELYGEFAERSPAFN